MIDVLSSSFTLQDDHQAHNSKHDRLQPGMFTEHNGHVSDRRDITANTADDVLLSV